MKELFEAWSIGGMRLKNRVVRAATQQSFVAENGIVTEVEAGDLEEKARGGAAMLITGMMGVGENARVYDKMIDVSDESFVASYRPVAERVHVAGARLCAQLTNCGFKAYLIDRGDLPYAPSDRVENGELVAREMTGDDIALVVSEFARAAAKCKEAGIDAVEVHAAHGYLLSQFLCPLSNSRTDEYGGPIENRARLAVQVVKAMRGAVGDDYPILVKINGSDHIEGGMTKEESLQACLMLQDAGADAIEVSGGVGFDAASSSTRPGIKLDTQGSYVDDASFIADSLRIPVICVCGFRDPAFIEKTLDTTSISAVSICRPIVRESGIVNRWQSGDRTPSACISCNRCFGAAGPGCPVLQMQQARQEK